MRVDPKPFKTYEMQLALVKERGMTVEDDAAALSLLARAGYYTLSGYWHSLRLKRSDGSRTDRFRDGATFGDVGLLWEFDNRLRASTFAALQPIEMSLRAQLGYRLGEVDPLVHLRAEDLSIDDGSDYRRWLEKLEQNVRDSREEFIVHHRRARGGVIPIWVAVDVLDWGGLSYLYSFTPPAVREAIAAMFGLTAPQLKSWLRALNVVRNVCAHHSRFFNRYYSLTLKLPAPGADRSLDEIRSVTNSTFAMLTAIQHLIAHTPGAKGRILCAAMRSFPRQNAMNLGALGAPDDWEAIELWSRA